MSLEWESRPLVTLCLSQVKVVRDDLTLFPPQMQRFAYVWLTCGILGVHSITCHSCFLQHLGLVPFGIVSDMHPNQLSCSLLSVPLLCSSGRLMVVSDCSLAVCKEQNKLVTCINHAQSL